MIISINNEAFIRTEQDTIQLRARAWDANMYRIELILPCCSKDNGVYIYTFKTDFESKEYADKVSSKILSALSEKGHAIIETKNALQIKVF